MSCCDSNEALGNLLTVQTTTSFSKRTAPHGVQFVKIKQCISHSWKDADNQLTGFKIQLQTFFYQAALTYQHLHKTKSTEGCQTVA